MKQIYKFKKTLAMMFLPVALGSLPMMAAPMDLIFGNPDNIACAEYYGVDEKGNTFGFYYEEDWDNWIEKDGDSFPAPKFYLSGINLADKGATSVTIPDKISYNYKGYDFDEPLKLVDFRFYNHENSFAGAEKITDLYFPSCIEKIYAFGSDKLWQEMNLHLTSENAPYIFFIEGSETWLNLIVNNSRLSAYKEQLEDRYFIYPENAERPYKMILKEGEVEHIANSNYHCVDEDGTIYGFNVSFDGNYIYNDRGNGYYSLIPSEIQFNGMIGGKKNKDLTSFTLPSDFVIAGGNKVCKNLSFDKVVIDFQGDVDAFYGMSNLTDVYLPSGVLYIESKGSSLCRPLNLHLASDKMAEIYLVQSPAQWINLFVAANKYDEYKNALNGRYFLYKEGDKNLEEKMILRACEENTIPGSNFIGKDKDGNIYGFNIRCDEGYHGYYWTSTNPQEVRFEGIVPSVNNINATSFTIPADFLIACGNGLVYENPGYYGVNLKFQHDGDKSFPGMDKLKEIYFPPTVEEVKAFGNDLFDFVNFHMTSNFVPYFEFWDRFDEWVKIYVADDMFMTYDSQLGDYNFFLLSEKPAEPTVINVETPGTLADKLYETLKDLTLNDVRWLVVKGVPNNEDILLFRRMYRLEILDLSATTSLKTFEKCEDLKFLYDVTLPENIVELGENAFKNTRYLTSLKVPESVVKIGRNAFSDCYRLRNINLPEKVTVIDDGAFRNTRIGNDFNLKNVEKIGSMTFADCPELTDIDLTSLKEFGGYSFYGCRNLHYAKLGDDLKEIPYETFMECDLQEIIIPDGVTAIGDRAFENNGFVKYMELGRNLSRIDWRAFRYVRPETVVNNKLFPISFGEDVFDSRDELMGSTLYVPHLTLNSYLLHDSWTMFANVEPIEGDLTDVTINEPFTLTTNYGIANKANLTNESEFTVNREYALNLNKYTHKSKYDYWDWNWQLKNCSLLVNSKMTADNVEVTLSLPAEQWQFLSFPFDVKVGEIVVDAQDQSSLWVVRKYSGEDRAKLTENTWQNMTDNMILKAGEGYIFHCRDVENGKSYIDFTFKAFNDGNAIFNTGDINTKLEEYLSEFPHNASWNLVGNTYPAFVNIHGVDFGAPITVWDNWSYYAYSPLDDEYILKPFQAFFVQRQDWNGGDVLTIKPQARGVNYEDALLVEVEKSLKAPAKNLSRALFNLNLAGDKGKDRTRVVINEEALEAYESNRDAAKFMSLSEEVPQIYVLNNKVRMAIDERPLGNGEINLGVRFSQKGNYVIELDSRDAENYRVSLLDRNTGSMVDITSTPYAFTADAGIDEERFVLIFNYEGAPNESGVEDMEVSDIRIDVEGSVLEIIAPEAVEILVFTADGKTVVNDKAAKLSIELEKGVYIVKAGNKTIKTVVGK